MFDVIESLWFNGPNSTVGLVIIDNGFEVKAYIGALPESYTEAFDAQIIAQRGVPFPVAGALAISGAARARQLRYDKQSASVTQDRADAMAYLAANLTPAAPWTDDDFAEIKKNSPGRFHVQPCGCGLIVARACWDHFGGSKNTQCHWLPHRSHGSAPPTGLAHAE